LNENSKISEEDITNLFQDFYWIKNQQTKNITDSGLGLSILKKIVELIHETITVESSPGKRNKIYGQLSSIDKISDSKKDCLIY